MVGSHQEPVTPEPRTRLEPFGKLMGHPLGHLASVDEDKGRPVSDHQFGEAIKNLPELSRRSDRLQLGVLQFDGDTEITPVATIDDLGERPAGTRPAEQASHDIKWTLRRRQADPLEPATVRFNKVGKAFEAER